MRQFMALEQGVTIPSNAIIDVQVKRIHEYKRQQMLALYIIWKYLDIKNGNRPKLTPSPSSLAARRRLPTLLRRTSSI